MTKADPPPANEREIMPTGIVLEIIAPVCPDNLQHVGQGVYEAKWIEDARGEAQAEIEQLRQVNRVTLLTDIYRPENLPSWIAVQFCIEHVAILTIEGVQ